MGPVTASALISAPREEIFDYLSDMAGRVAYADHYLKDFRLARLKTQGKGAAARFRIEPPFGKAWAETAITESERPRRIVEEGRLGVLGRSKLWTVYELAEEEGRTRVELTTRTEPGNSVDALRERLGGRRWLERQLNTALERLRTIFEDRRDSALPRASIAGYEPLSAPRFGGSPVRLGGPGAEAAHDAPGPSGGSAPRGGGGEGELSEEGGGPEEAPARADR